MLIDMNDNEKEVVNNFLSFAKFCVLALLVIGGFLGTEFLI